jgi:hypothetical protein
VEVLVRVAVAREVLHDMRHILPVHLPRGEEGESEHRREGRDGTLITLRLGLTFPSMPYW